MHDAYLRAFEYFGSFRGGDARPWLLTIVRRTSYEWLARNRPAAIRGGFDEEIDGVALSDDTPTPVNPETQALTNASRASLNQAIAELPVGFREVLILRELEELSYKEIAAIVGVPIGTVMSRLSRARALLQGSPRLRDYAIGATATTPPKQRVPR